MEYDGLMDAARKFNRKLDAIERSSGILSESEQTPTVQIATAMMAIKNGILREDWSSIAEAQAMLEVTYQKLTGKPVRV